MKTTMKRVTNLILVFRSAQTALKANHSLSSDETLPKMSEGNAEGEAGGTDTGRKA